jgi:hypothetical protein
MLADIKPDSDDELISSIAPDVMKCLERARLFEKLDDLLSPQDNSIPPQTCDGTYNISEGILLASGFEHADLEDIFAVLHSKGGCCDCEVLYNVSETNRLKANYWRRRAEGLSIPTGHPRPLSGSDA